MAESPLCYLCGERGPVSRDHVPGRWLSRAPRAPLCVRCKHATDDADGELRRFVGDPRLGSDHSTHLIGRALDKLARGLQWVHGGDRIADDTLTLWEHRVGEAPFALDRDKLIAELAFGPDLTCAVGEDRYGYRWRVSLLGHVHFAITYLDMTSWWRRAAAARAAR